MAINDRLKARLDLLATVLVMLASLSVIGSLGWRWLNPPAAPRVSLPMYEIGETFPDVPGMLLSSNGPTLVAWLQSTCRYCTASMDFYRALVEKRRVGKIVAMGPESSDVLGAYLKEHKVVVDQVVSVSGKGLKLYGTPTLVLVGQDRRVINVWKGQVKDQKAQADVIALMR